MNENQKNICLLFHCLYQDGKKPSGPHEELFVPVGEIRRALDELLMRGYILTLPWMLSQDKPNCIITFDDGYFNVNLFNDISKEYKCPFLLFINSYNIIKNKPFIWDIWEANNLGELPLAKYTYKQLYQMLDKDSYCQPLNNDHHRPFNIDEIKSMVNNNFIKLGLHTHHHQPMLSKYSGDWQNEIDENRRLFIDNNIEYVEEFSFPCGIYDRSSMSWAQNRFRRVYTSDIGSFKSEAKTIERIPLLSISRAGGIIPQIDRSINPNIVRTIRRKIGNIKRALQGPIR